MRCSKEKTKIARWRDCEFSNALGSWQPLVMGQVLNLELGSQSSLSLLSCVTTQQDAYIH